MKRHQIHQSSQGKPASWISRWWGVIVWVVFLSTAAASIGDHEACQAFGWDGCYTMDIPILPGWMALPICVGLFFTLVTGLNNISNISSAK